MAQYEVNNSSIQTLLSWIRSGEIAIPEIQRPFVWDSTKVRDLIDSLRANCQELARQMSELGLGS